ncbi:MAG: hypothetical protein ACRBF0_21995 [Calditrichia bacterium]
MSRNIFILMFASATFLLVAWTYLTVEVKTDGASEPSGVVLSAPPDYWVVEVEVEAVGSPRIESLAIEALKIISENPQKEQIALKYISDEKPNFFLINLLDEEIQQMAVNKYGTAVQKTWSGKLKERLQHGAKTGLLTPAGMNEPISRNLYH